MKKYSVRVPFTGFIDVTVEAKNEKDAKDKFWDLEITGFDHQDVDHYEWEYHEIICKGNVLYASQNEIEVEEL